MEISIIGARDKNGSVSCYDPGENYHENGILKTTTVPAKITQQMMTDAVLLTGKIMNKLDYVGVIGVELFVSKNGLIVNEIAPRVHNSGHWTQNGCIVDQFEQHIRAITGLQLGDGTRHSDVKMTNILGADITKLDNFINNGKSALHLYGKETIKSGRKMGHINEIY
jgi:5-(carboxyamino)imidazole ribonucleotide synthase